MKGLVFLVKAAAILVSLAAVVCTLAVFRDELIDLFHGFSARVSKKHDKCDNEYADFADV